jgi:hypothetical protein
MGKFEELYQLNVNDKVEKKGTLKYLSWTYAWAEFKKAYPDARYEVNQFDGTYCTGNEKMGYMVHTKVTAGEQTYEMWLPIMDSRNATILAPKMTEINKTIMRCLTKNLAMFGLGLYIYAGEDLPETDGEESNGAGENVKPIKTAKKQPKNEPKMEDSPQAFKPITKDEILRVWGVKNVEETIVWFEGKFGIEFANWGEEETGMARMKLAEKKQKREAEEQRKNGMARIDDSDLPFSMGD